MLLGDSIQILSFDTGIDVQALIVAVVAVFAPLFLFILTAKFGYRIVRAVLTGGLRLFGVAYHDNATGSVYRGRHHHGDPWEDDGGWRCQACGGYNDRDDFECQNCDGQGAIGKAR